MATTTLFFDKIVVIFLTFQQFLAFSPKRTEYRLPLSVCQAKIGPPLSLSFSQYPWPSTHAKARSHQRHRPSPKKQQSLRDPTQPKSSRLPLHQIQHSMYWPLEVHDHHEFSLQRFSKLLSPT